MEKKTSEEIEIEIEGKRGARGLILMLLGMCILSGVIMAFSAEATSEITIVTTDGGSMVFNLENPVDRGVLRTKFARDPRMVHCLERADWAVDLMEERDAGRTQDYHLQRVREEYEKTENIPRFIFVDYGRTVRDVHRSAGSNTEGFRYTDPNELWIREFKWCAIYRSG